MSHTPGPWQVMDNSRTLLHIETWSSDGKHPAGDGVAICSVPRGPKGAANADLIALAPAMKALLERMRPHVHARWGAEIDALLAPISSSGVDK